MHDPGIGRQDAPAALSTPGRAEMRDSDSRKNLVACGSSYRDAGSPTLAVEHAVDAEAQVGALQLDEAAHQQAGAGEQDERQRHFGDHERAEHAVQPRAAAVTAAFAQRVAGGARRDECGDDPEEDPGRERDDQAERDDRQVERQPGRAAEPESDPRPAREGRDDTTPRRRARRGRPRPRAPGFR